MLLIVSGPFSIAILVGGLEHGFYFVHILGIIQPTDELIFFRGVENTNQYYVELLDGGCHQSFHQ